MVQPPTQTPSQESFLSDKQTFGSIVKGVWFEFRASVLRAVRFMRNRLARAPFARTYIAPGTVSAPHLLAESSSPLWTALSAGEMHLVAGKIQNLRLAAAKLDGLLIAPGQVFSFWEVVGPPTRWRGYVAGRELREGCMVASVGGGLCQLSNALHLAALEAGVRVIERHAHSRVVPGSIAETGKDATVFWNYKDLRISASQPILIRAQLTRARLIIRFLSTSPKPSIVPEAGADPALTTHEHAHDCVECHHRDCVNFVHASVSMSKTTVLLDSVWPEFDAWLRGQNLSEKDLALLPMNGSHRKIPAYRWFADHPSRPLLREHPLFTYYRSFRSRRLKAQGATRQAALLEFDAQLARFYSREIPVDSDRLTVPLPLLGPLAKLGSLGGREVTVLLTRAPLLMLQEQLDLAARLYADSPTIKDFRLPRHVLDREMNALRGAHLLLTPHTAVAEFLHEHGIHHIELLPWTLPQATSSQKTNSKTILFPASALARKGAYEMRAALEKTGLTVRVLGRAQERPGFWGDHVVLDSAWSSSPDRSEPLRGVAVVVLPAHVENQPRLLLQALASSIPVIATPNCGLPVSLTGLHLVPAGNAQALAAKIQEVVSA